ncbi:large secreted [Cryptosporidium xiaoi]|uniref:Large secreted n=1 Tax=Cryptosporidium xiaoi TaxID=659607 RepID=A0AAV9XZP5_9CRYT
MRIFILLVFNITINFIYSQVPGAVYEKISSVESYHSQNGTPYGCDIKNGKSTPAYYETIWAGISVPPIITACQYVQPITLTVGNLNHTNPVVVEFSCNSKYINGDSQIMTQYGVLKVSNSMIILPICEAFVNILNDIKPTLVQTYTYTNLTYYITNDMIESILHHFSVLQYGINDEKEYEWLSNHIYSENWYNITSDLNLPSLISPTITIPLQYKIFLPDDLLPGKFVIGSNGDHYYIDGFNVTILDITNNTSNSELWVPKNGLGGFLPTLTPVYQMKVVPYINNVTTFFNDAAITWGYTNYPFTVTPVRIIPPTRFPESNNNSQICSSNFDFYYPTRPYSISGEEIINNTDSLKDLRLLLPNKTNLIYQRNTIQSSNFFNKYAMMNDPKKDGILDSTAVPFEIINDNFIGGCYFNGTYPLVPSIENKGVTDVGRCSSEQLNTSTLFKTPFYPPPLKFEGYFHPEVDQPGVYTNIYQTVSYVQVGSPTIMSDSNKKIVGKYPGMSIMNQLFYGILLQGPRIIWQSPYFFNPNNPLNPKGSFYAISPQYIEKMFGSYNIPGGGSSCRGGRMIPLPTEMSDVNISWQCYTSKTPVSLLYATTTLKDHAFNVCMYAGTSSDLVNCNSDSSIPSTLNTATYTDNTWQVKIQSKDYKSSSPLLFIQNNTSPLTFYGYSSTGWWIETLTYPNNYPQWFLKIQTCSYLPEIPIIPTDIPQVFNIYSVTGHWDHIKNSHHFGLIPFLNKTTSFSIEVQLNETDYFSSNNEIIKFTSYLICDGFHSFELETYPSSVKAQDLLPPEKLTVSALIKPYILHAEENINCFVVFYVIPNSEKNSITPGTYGSLANQIPAAPRKGIGEYIYYVSADMPPLMDEIKLLIPNPGKTSISDTIFIQNNKILFPTPEQSSVFPSIGIIASSDPILKQTSKIIILGDQLQLFQQSIRLPSVVSEWYVFLKATTPSNSGCLIPCDSSLKNHYVTPYCSFDGKTPICPYEKVEMASYDSQQEIEDLIAVATHPLSYLSLTDVLQVGVSLFSQPSSNSIIWKDYFDLLFEMLIEQPKTPSAADFSASKIMVFSILNMILNEAYNNPKLEIDTIRPFNTILNNTLNAECSNSPGFKYLLLDTIDLLIATNGWDFFTSNPEYLNLIGLLLQSIGNRISFFDSVGYEFKWNGLKSKIEFHTKIFTNYDLKNGLNIGDLYIPQLMSSNQIQYKLVESIYMLNNPKYFDQMLADSYWVPSCPNNTMAISVIKYPNNIIKNALNKSLSLESHVVIPIISTTFYSCSIDYNLINIPSPVVFSIDIQLDVAVNITSLRCGVKINNKWDNSYCTTYHTYNSSNPRKSSIQCQCKAIAEYGLIGTVTPLNKFQTDTTTWPGFNGDFEGIIPNISEIKPIFKGVDSGFVFVQGESTKVKDEYGNLEDSQIGRYSVNYKRKNNLTMETYGLLQQESSNKEYSNLDFDFLYSWEPLSSNSTSNVTIEKYND